MERVFSLSGLLVLPLWALFILAPRWRVTLRVARSPGIVLLPIVLYAALVLPALATILPVVARPTLASVIALLATPVGATAAWAHFLAFDLFVGRWIFLDADAARTTPRALAAPLVSLILVLTLMLGPLGLLSYLVARTGWLQDAYRRVRQGNRALARLGLGCLALLAVALGLMAIDSRQVLGASTWLKPAKFALSVAITSFTLAWVLRHLPLPTKGGRRAVALVVWLFALELVIIAVQAARGVPSHFNNATALDGFLFGVMGLGVVVATGGIAYIAFHS